MKLSALAVQRPVTVLMFVMILILLGSISLSRLPIDLLPDIEAPVIAVQTSYDDAGPFEVENFVTRPIEEALASVDRVSSISSTSRRGSSTVVAQFDWGIDMDFASLDVRERVDLVRDLLPDGVGSPMIVKFDPTDMPIMELVVTGDASLAELRYAADNVVQSRLERLEGVASVNVSGGQEREIQVDLHPGRMQTHGVSMDSIVQTLQASNLNLPAGTVSDAPMSYILRTTGEYESIDQLQEQRVPNANGALIPLREVADVVDGHKEARQLSRFQGSPSVLLTVQKEAAANSVQVAERIHHALGGIGADLDSGMSLDVAQDLTVFIQQSVQDVTRNALFGGVLAMIVLLVFLRSFRPTLIVAFAIPVSVLSTFILMYFSDTSINMISLGGLALGVGMLVDNAIVVLENIFRHKEEGYSRERAGEVGAAEVGTAITASTLTTISVFLPVVFIAGIAAEIFRDMALTVTFSLGASLIISLTLVPMLASKILPEGDLREIRLLSPLRALLSRVQQMYGRIIPWVLHRRGGMIALVAALLVFSLAVVPRVGMEFLPDFDQGEIQVTVRMPRGTELRETDRVVSRIEHYARTLPEADAVFTSVGGGSMMAGGANFSTGRIGVVLLPRVQRDRSTQQVVQELRDLGTRIPGAEVSVSMMDSMGAFFGDPVQIELRGDDMEELEQASIVVLEAINGIPGIVDPVSSLEDREPEMQIRVDRQRASDYGISVAELASSMQTAVSGSSVTRYRTGGQEIDITVRLAERWRDAPDVIMDVPIQTQRGAKPLGELAVVQAGTSPVAVDRSDRSRIVSVSSQLQGRDLAGAMDEIARVLQFADLPSGVSLDFGGESEEMMEAFGQLSLAMLLGILLVFMVLASQFESLLQPVIIMVTLPLAVIGVMAGLVFTGTTFSVVGFVGAIMLAGIVVNNAIVFVDYVNQLRRDGLERTDALRKAGEIRLRPILMTSFTTILAMVPLAIGIGEGQELQRPIAVVVIGGLAASTFLTLFVIPAFYTYVDDLEQWFVKRLFKKEGDADVS